LPAAFDSTDIFHTHLHCSVLGPESTNDNGRHPTQVLKKGAWTPEGEEEAVMQGRREDKAIADIARDLCRTPTAVRQRYYGNEPRNAAVIGGWKRVIKRANPPLLEVQVGQKRSSCGFEEPGTKRSHGGADVEIEMVGSEALDLAQFGDLEPLGVAQFGDLEPLGVGQIDGLEPLGVGQFDDLLQVEVGFSRGC
jgi:hypothetical protein